MKTNHITLHLLACIAILFMYSNVYCQVTVSASLNDVWSKDAYSDMTKDYAEVAIQTQLQRAATVRLKKLHVDYNNELTDIGVELSNKKLYFQKFCTQTSVNYVNSKYRETAMNKADVSYMKNKIKRLRLQKRLVFESTRIGDYLDKKNPISQGKRVFLVLSALEKSIQIALEKEEF